MVKSHQISNWVFIALFIVSIIVFGMFYLVGFDNPQGEYNAPEYTDLLIKFMYFMIVLCIVAAVGFAIFNGISLVGGPKGVNISGVPGGLIAGVSWGIFVIALVVSYIMASDAPIKTGDGVYDDVFWLKMTDMFIYAIYALMVVASLGLVVNLTGIFKKLS